MQASRRAQGRGQEPVQAVDGQQPVQPQAQRQEPRAGAKEALAGAKEEPLAGEAQPELQPGAEEQLLA